MWAIIWPAVTALIAVAGLAVMESSFLYLDSWGQFDRIGEWVDPLKLICFFAAFFFIRKFNKSPIFYIAISAVVGMIAGL